MSLSTTIPFLIALSQEEEEARQKAKAKEVKPPKQEVTAMSISPEVIKQIADVSTWEEDTPTCRHF